MKKLLLILAAAVTVAACGQKSEPIEPAAAPPAPQTADAATPPTTPATNADLDKAAAANQESAGGETTAGDASLDRMVPMPASAQLPAGRWTVGKNYRPITPAQPTTAAAGEVEVIEFMWLACVHCYQLNERMTAWKARAPAWVKFRQEHVMWGPSHRELGRLLYTLEALKREDLVQAAFEHLHRDNLPLVDATEEKTLALQLAFARKNGLSEADYKREFNGFAVRTRLQRAEDLTRRYRVDQTPVFVVNGKYYTDVSMAGGPAQLTQLLDDLVAAEKR